MFLNLILMTNSQWISNQFDQTWSMKRYLIMWLKIFKLIKVLYVILWDKNRFGNKSWSSVDERRCNLVFFYKYNYLHEEEISFSFARKFFLVVSSLEESIWWHFFEISSEKIFFQNRTMIRWDFLIQSKTKSLFTRIYQRCDWSLL